YEHTNLILVGVFFALLPDGLIILSYYAKNINKIPKSINIIFKFLKSHEIFHKKIHSKISSKHTAIICQTIIIIFLIINILFFS
ncbi:hypothetical protein KJ671_02770, partial [Patescibacteria group bacterium]|nr:hypothetical protein [Patescibacteria group bacterium]